MKQFGEIAIPANLIANHVRNGGDSLRRFVADVDDGQLRVMMGREPFGEPTGIPAEKHVGRPRKWHISVSVGKVGEVGAFRKATDAELKGAVALLELAAIAMWHGHVELEEDNEGQEPGSLVRHLWEK